VPRRARRRFVRLIDVVGSDAGVDPSEVIRSGQVTVNGLIVRNPRAVVPADARVARLPPPLLRGTVKLRAALRFFRVTVAREVCLDVGAAAGGFTAALVEAGAARVYAVDAGYGQLRGWLRQHPRVVNLERTNLADLSAEIVPEPVGLVCLDLSYLPLGEALPQLRGLPFAHHARLLALVKPTFELKAASLVVDPYDVERARRSAEAGAARAGFHVVGYSEPMVTGAKGAVELFLYAELER
jgi:23S rRNA (cytidine1920-2'-O)/16S rRNA (cytidine1409-2'-O)-methyltransferase